MKKWIVGFLILCLLFGSIPYLSSVADDTVEDIENELDDLNSEVENITAELSTIATQLSQISSDIFVTRQELAEAKGQLEIQYEAMKLRIQYMYENGDYAMVNALLKSGNVNIFLNQATYFQEINSYDREALKKLQDTQSMVEEKESQLVQKQKDLESLQKSLVEKEAQLYSDIAVANEELKVAQAKIAAAKAEAEAAKAEAAKPVEPYIPPQEPQQDEPKPEIEQTDAIEGISEEDLILFAALIECEAGSTNYEGMLAVASVVVNRMKHRLYPNTLRGVIFQSGQFPPATNGLVDRILNRGIKQSCLNAAKDALAGKNNVGDCLSFRAASSGHAGKVIGDNVFF